MRIRFAMAAATLLPVPLQAAPIPVRQPLGAVAVAPAKTVARVEATRVVFAPGQEMPRHRHSVPVVCFVAKGSFVYSIGAAPVQSAHEGDVTIEPAEATVNFFRNASTRAPAELLCAALAGPGETPRAVMLDRPKSPVAR
jgi:quercetin dioxygenase-like cupin family protein